MIAKAPTTHFFKGFSNMSLQKIFENEKIFLDIDWSKRKAKSDISVGEKWLEYMVTHRGDDNVKKLFEVFQHILVIVKSGVETNTVIENAEKAQTFKEPLPDGFYGLPKAEQGAIIYLSELQDGLTVLRYLADIIYAKDLNLYRDQFIVYEASPGALTDINVKKPLLRSALDEFFISQKKGSNCKIEYYEGWDGHYFYATLDGAREFLDLKTPSDLEFTLKEVIRPYEVIFLYDSENGKLSLHTPTKFGKKTDALAGKILEILIDTVDKKRLEKDQFNLSCFANINFEFPVMPNEKVKTIHATKIGFMPAGFPKNEIVIINTKKDDAYRSFIESICWFQGAQHVPEHRQDIKFSGQFTVTQIGIQIIMNDDSAINFYISTKGCTHPGHASEAKRKVAEALIQKLKLRGV